MDIESLFKNTARKISLSSEKKQKMRDSINAFIQTTPMKEEGLSHFTNKNNRIWSIRFSQKTFVERFILQPMPIILVLSLLFGTGTLASVSAEKALPGDVLYPVKIGVNENVKSLFAVSNESEAKLKASFAETRLKEAEILASEGRLNNETRKTIETRFTSQSEEVKHRLNVLKNQENGKASALSISSDFEASLRAHANVLSAISVKNDDTQENLSPIVNATNAQASIVGEVKTNTETEIIDSKSSAMLLKVAEQKKQEAENKIQELIEAIKKRQNPNIDVLNNGNIEIKLNLAQELVKQGQGYFDKRMYGRALVLFQESLSTVQKALIELTGIKEEKVPIIPNPGIITSSTPSEEEKNPSEISNDEASARAKYKEAISTVEQIRFYISVSMRPIAFDAEEIRLQLADKLIAQGKAYLDIKAYGKAIQSFIEAIDTAKGISKSMSNAGYSDPGSGGSQEIDKIDPSFIEKPELPKKPMPPQKIF